MLVTIATRIAAGGRGAGNAFRGCASVTEVTEKSLFGVGREARIVGNSRNRKASITCAYEPSQNTHRAMRSRLSAVMS